MTGQTDSLRLRDLPTLTTDDGQASKWLEFDEIVRLYRAIRVSPAWDEHRRLMAEAIIRLMIEAGLQVKEVSYLQVEDLLFVEPLTSLPMCSSWHRRTASRSRARRSRSTTTCARRRRRFAPKKRAPCLELMGRVLFVGYPIRRVHVKGAQVRETREAIRDAASPRGRRRA